MDNISLYCLNRILQGVIAFKGGCSKRKMQSDANGSGLDRVIKIGLTLLVFSAIVLQSWNALTPVPPFLQPAIPITKVVLFIHAVEGVIAAFLVFRYRQRLSNSSQPLPTSLLTEKLPDNTPLAVIKGGLYAFFIGLPGLSEIMQASKQSQEVSP